MMLVDIPSETNVNNGTNLALQSDFLQNYITPKTGFNLDQNLRHILTREDINDHDKWKLYNQSLQRFLFLLDEERRKNPYQNIFNKTPSSKQYNSYTTQMIPPTNRNYGTFVKDIQRPPIDSVQNINSRAYNHHIQRGQYDFSPRKRVEYNHTSENSIDDTNFQSALDVPLPLSDIPSDEEGEENEEQQKKLMKRKMFDTPGIQKKQLRKQKRPIYSYGFEPLQRWAVKQKAKTNKNRLQSLLHSLPPTSQQHENDEVEIMDIEPSSRKRKHEIEETVPDKMLRLDSPYPHNQIRRAPISLSRLPYPLTEEYIRRILKEDKEKLKIKKWEKLPQRLARQ